MNNTTDTQIADGELYIQLRHAVECVILIISVTGNVFLMTVLIKLRKVDKLIDKLIFNLSFCNILLVLISVPTTVVLEKNMNNYPFGYAGCKLIAPFATYSVNTGVFTLLVVAFERWKVVSKPFAMCASTKKILLVFVLLHITGFISVLPYMVILNYTVNENSVATCTEDWDISSSRVYTIALFLIQYGIPVPLMLYFYGNAWREIQTSDNQIFQRLLPVNLFTLPSNDSTIALQVQRPPFFTEIRNSVKTMPEDSIVSNFSSTPHDCTDTEKGLSSRTIDKNNNKRIFKKASTSSTRSTRRRSKDSTQGSFMRYMSPASAQKFADLSTQNKAFMHRFQQSRELLRMFSVVVLVFVIFMLPNQVFWMIVVFASNGDENFNQYARDIVYVLTYANCVLNPIIYGRLNKSFRKGFKKIYSTLKCKRNRSIIRRRQKPSIV